METSSPTTEIVISHIEENHDLVKLPLHAVYLDDGNAEDVEKATREKIFALADFLNYSPTNSLFLSYGELSLMEDTIETKAGIAFDGKYRIAAVINSKDANEPQTKVYGLFPHDYLRSFSLQVRNEITDVGMSELSSTLTFIALEQASLARKLKKLSPEEAKIAKNKTNERVSTYAEWAKMQAVSLQNLFNAPFGSEPFFKDEGLTVNWENMQAILHNAIPGGNYNHDMI